MNEKSLAPQVVLLHGMMRSSLSMGKLSKHLSSLGYRVFNPGYNSMLNNYQQILDGLDKKVTNWIDPLVPVYFVGHSFGGLLIRGLLSRHPEWTKGRCVMLGTPNKGSKVASFMLSHWWYKYFVPKVTADLKPDSEMIKTLPEPDIETGIIAGNVKYSIIIPASWYYKKATDDAPGDGIVELSTTRCDTMADFIIMPLHHSFMMWDKDLLEQVVHFLEQGSFTDEYKPVEDLSRV